MRRGSSPTREATAAKRSPQQPGPLRQAQGRPRGTRPHVPQPALSGVEGPNAALTNYVHATHYGYDVHGNVERAVQDFPFLNQFGMRFSVTEYEYETVSGNILKVTYRKGQADQLYHRYSYDRTNRLIVTETSRDGVIWDKDARYYYYAHGPLARTETGTQKVQGTDVAYTVNGWTKAVNATRLTPQNDAGHDGDHAVLSAANTNRGFARDAFGYGLTYFRNDYTSAGTQAMEAADMFDTGTDFGAAIAGEGQYNGNIAAMTTALRGPDGTAQDELGQVYAYDQLYRLQNTRGFLRAPSARFRWSGVPGTTKWNTSYTYDANGNIATLKRQDQAGAAMDDITYDYARSGGRLTDNRLQHATDAVASSSNPDDYEVGLPLTGNNFNYDRNGNLVYDKSEGIDKIVWNVYGKVTKVDRTAGHAKPDLEFYYDASGRRVMKIVKPNGGSGAKNTWKYVVFSYDAGGQLMAEYETAYKSGTYGLVNTGNYVYGSKRLGKTREKIPLGPMVNYTEIQNCTACATAPVVPGNTAPENIYARTAGNKQYEFANHLGNVLVTVSDRHLQTDDGSYSYLGGTLTQTGTVPDGLLDYYMPQVLTANDYYPGGMPMPGRICSTQTTVVTAVLRDDPFNSGTASYTGTNGATLSNSSGTLLVTKLSSATDSWGARTPAHTLTAGVEYRLSYLLTLGACSAGRETRGWRVVDAAGNDIAGNIVLGTGPFNVNGTFTVPATGTYYIEFYRNTSSTGTCSFTIDNVLLISNTYLTVKVCGTPAEQYAWGHNGQYKDDEIYGPGNTYTAEYWEYDSRLIRRWNTDPIAYDWQSPYACFNNNPIYFADPLGQESKKGDRRERKATKAERKELEITKDPASSDGNSYTVKTKKSAKEQILAGLQKIGTFFDGLANAFVTNQAGGYGRYEKMDLVDKYGEDNVRTAQYGQLTGDILSVYVGALEMSAGATMTEGGGVLTTTVIGAEAGIPLSIAGVGVISSGAVMTGAGVANGTQTAIDLMNSDGTASNPGQAAQKANSGVNTSGEAANAANNKIGTNAKKMNENDLANFFGNKDWHKSSAKRDYLKRFFKQLKGDTNADFYIDKISNEVLLKSNKSANWIKTGDFIK